MNEGDAKQEKGEMSSTVRYQSVCLGHIQSPDRKQLKCCSSANREVGSVLFCTVRYLIVIVYKGSLPHGDRGRWDGLSLVLVRQKNK